MFDRVIRRGFIFTICLTAVSANATWLPYLKPIELVFEGEDDGARAYVMFELKTPIDECSKDGGYIRIKAKSKKGEYFVTTLLTAIASGKEVRPAMSGCDDWGRPILNGLMIR